MKIKKIGVILIAIVFAFMVVFSCVFAFSLKRVHVAFAVSNETDAESIQSALDDYLGDNILFLDLDKVQDTLKNFHYMEVLSVKKDFPNVLRVELKERREIYYIPYNDGYCVTTENGFVLRKTEILEETARDKIAIQLDGVSILEANIGSYIKTNNDVVINTVFEMAKSVNLTDCIKSITVKKTFEEMGVGVFDASFNTYTGVSMSVERLESFGVEKTINAFKVYDEILSDYQKSEGEIQSYYVKTDGRFRVTYNQKDVWTSEE